ncbi:MAG: heme ABC exporter ATP-binding protein CcmA [Pseudomonadota bacterium]
MSGEVLIEAQAVGAMRGERLLFRDLDLDVRAGETVLLRGANGSGKTTLLRQLAGLSEVATGVIARSAGQHWLGHTNGLKAHETPRTHLRHWARVWGSDVDIDGVLERMAMTRPADVPCRMLSAGQKRRTALGRLLLVERPLWLLDEPFNALDAAGRDLLAGMIEAHCDLNGAVIAALHGDTPVAASREVVL